MKSIVCGLILFSMTSLTGFAAQRQSVTVNFDDSIVVGGNTVQRGSYLVRWNMPGPETQVSFLKGSKIVASIPAKITPADNVAETKDAPNGVALAIKQSGDHRELKELELPHFNATFTETQ